MATNFHSDLPNDQIHSPKDFSTANQSSVPIKNLQSELEWSKANYTTVSTIKTTADSYGTLHGTYFNVFLNDTTKYNVYYKVTGETSTFVPELGFTGVEVIINANETPTDVAIKTAFEFNRIAGFTASSSTNYVTLSGMASSKDSVAAASPFFISNVQTPVGNEVLQTDASGNIKWAASSGGGGVVTSLTTTGESGLSTLSSGVLNIPDYSGERYLSQNIEAYGSLASGIEYGLNNGQYNSEHKFSVNLGVPPITTITPKNMVTTSIWCNPAVLSLKRFNGWIWGPNTNIVTLSLLRVKMNCPNPAPSPSTVTICRASTKTLTLLGNNNPVCFDLTTFLNTGLPIELAVNEMLVLTASTTTGKGVEFNLNANILLT